MPHRRAAIIVALSLLPFAVSAEQAERPIRSLTEIEHVYHGVAVDRDLTVLTLKPEAIGEILDRAITGVRLQVRAPKPGSLDRLRTAMADKGDTDLTRLAVKGAMLDDLIAQAAPARRAQLAVAADWLAGQTQALRPAGDSERKGFATLTDLSRVYQIDPSRFSRWVRPDWWKIPPIQLSYTQQCKLAEVPLPPRWGDPAWSNRGAVPQSLLFLALGNPVEAWASNVGDKGACIALPRWGWARRR